MYEGHVKPTVVQNRAALQSVRSSLHKAAERGQWPHIVQTSAAAEVKSVQADERRLRLQIAQGFPAAEVQTAQLEQLR
jgi:hypothetical protein